MKKSVLIAIIIILIIIIAVSCTLIFKENNKSGLTTSVLTKSNVVSNDILVNMVNEQISNKVENTIENEYENTNEEIQNTQISTETFEENPKTQEEKAIEIVKKDWNESQNIKYGVEGMDENGRYIVTVRDSQTTKALAFYTVNVSNKTFDKREMN